MGKPLLVEIIAYAPTGFYHCTHCEVVWREAGVSRSIHQEQMDSSLPDDLAREYQGISRWVEELFQRYDNRIIVKVIDAASLEGLFKSLQYGVHRYPAVIVNRQARFTVQALEQAGGEIDRIFQEVQPSGTKT